MSMSFASPSNDLATTNYVAQAPRASDPISGALRSAFAPKDKMDDDFTALLRQIDEAERACSSD